MINIEFGVLPNDDSDPLVNPRSSMGEHDDSRLGKNCTDRSLAERGRKIVSLGVVISAGEQQDGCAFPDTWTWPTLGDGRGVR